MEGGGPRLRVLQLCRRQPDSCRQQGVGVLPSSQPRLGRRRTGQLPPRHTLPSINKVSANCCVFIFPFYVFRSLSRTIIGWTCGQNSVRIYFHQGEALILHSKDWESEDMSEICQRLKAVSQGAATQEFTLRRNQVKKLQI